MLNLSVKFRIIILISLLSIPSSLYSYTWYTTRLDTTVNSGIYTDLATDLMGYPHIIYKDLMYARWNGSKWVFEDILDSLNLSKNNPSRSSNAGRYSLELDSLGYPHITRPNNNYNLTKLEYIWKDSSGWLYKQLDSVPGICRTSLRLNSEEFPHIVFNNYNSHYNEGPWYWYFDIYSSIIYNYYNGTNCNSEYIVSDHAWDYFEDLGAWHWCSKGGSWVGQEGLSLALDSYEIPHVAYTRNSIYDISRRAIFYATFNSSGEWEIKRIDSSKARFNRPVAIEVSSKDEPYLAYSKPYPDYRNLHPYFARKEGGIWELECVDTNSHSGRNLALSLDSKGNPFLVYTSKGWVKLAWQELGIWNRELIDSCGKFGGTFSPHGIYGFDIDRDGHLHISYYKSQDSNRIWYTTTSPNFSSISWDINPDSMPINQPSEVRVLIEDSQGNPIPNVEVNIKGYGVDIYDTTENRGQTTDTLTFNFKSPYGGRLIVTGTNLKQGKELFIDYLPVYGGTDFLSWKIGAYSDTLGLSGKLMPGWRGNIWASSSPSDFILDLRECGVDSVAWTDSDSINLEVIPSKEGLIKATLLKQGYNPVTENITVNICKGIVSGYITDSIFSDSLENVSIKIYEEGVDTSQVGPLSTGKSNENGFYKMDKGIPFGEYNFYYSCSNYFPKKNTIFIKSDSTLNIKLIPGTVAIYGEIRDTLTGKPLLANISIYKTGSDSLYREFCTNDNGKYSVSLPPNQYRFKVEAKSYCSHQEIITPDSNTFQFQFKLYLFPKVFLMRKTFEDSSNGWDASQDWEWGMPDSIPIPHSGSHLWGTNLSGSYSSNSDSRLTTDTINLTGIREPVLSFYQWYQMRYGPGDGGNVKLSKNGGSWQLLDSLDPPYNGVASDNNAGIPGERCYYKQQEYWQEVKVDLSNFTGNKIRLRFHFGSNPNYEKLGWYIDDVTIYGKSINTSVKSNKIPANYSLKVRGIHYANQIKLDYTLPENSTVRCKVYDCTGRVVKSFSKSNNAGRYSYKIDMEERPSGIYFVKFSANKFSRTKKVVILK